MNLLFELLALVVVLSTIAGGVRVIRGPEPFDRMLAAQLFGTSGVAVLLLLSVVLGIDALLDVALVLALLAAVAGVVFIRLGAAAR